MDARSREGGGRGTDRSGRLLARRRRSGGGAGEFSELNLVDDVDEALAEDLVFFRGGFGVGAALDHALGELYTDDKNMSVFHKEEVAAFRDGDAVGVVELGDFVGEHGASGDENVGDQRALERAGDKFCALNLHALEGLFEIGEDEIAEKIDEVVLGAARGVLPTLGGVLREGGDADVDVEGVLESDDVGRIGNLTTEFGEDRDGDFEDAGGGN